VTPPNVIVTVLPTYPSAQSSDVTFATGSTVMSPRLSVVSSAYPVEPGPQNSPSLSTQDQLYDVVGANPVALQLSQ
jgi:hypothetical protein